MTKLDFKKLIIMNPTETCLERSKVVRNSKNWTDYF
jgi:hypothetical protein